MKYHVRLLVMSSGERLPVLSTSDGQPLMGPMIYVITELRAQGRASATIRHALEAILVLQMTLDQQQIDLNARMRGGKHLQIHEVDLIARSANQPIRAFGQDSARQLSRASAANRLHYIHHYLRWQAFGFLMQLDSHEKAYLALRDRVEKACSALKARSPCLTIRSQGDQRQGLTALCWPWPKSYKSAPQRGEGSAMADVLYFSPGHGWSAQQNLSQFVHICRSELSIFGAALNFDEDRWDVADYVDLKGHRGPVALLFTVLAPLGCRSSASMDEPFKSFAKSAIRYLQGLRPSKSLRTRLIALRALHRALTEAGDAADPTRLLASSSVQHSVKALLMASAVSAKRFLPSR